MRHHGGFQHRGVQDQRALDLERRDPDSGNLEHVVGTAAERVAAVGIARVFVAGVGPVALKRLPGFAALVPVAFGGRGRLDHELADLAVRYVFAPFVHQPHFVARHRTAGRTVFDVAGRIRQEDVQQLRRADAVEDVDAEARLPGIADRFRQRFACGCADAQPRAGALVLRRFVTQHGSKQRRRAIEDGRVVLVHEFVHPRRRRPFRIQHRTAADRHREGERIAEPIGEVQFCRGEADVALLDAEHLLAIGLRGGLQIGVQMSHALGHAGRARRIEPERRLLGMGLHRCEGIALLCKLLGKQLVAERIVAGHHDAFENSHPPDDILDDRI